MRKIYDCFSFYNELDLLEIRLKEMYDVVDYFVIAEANTTHSGKPKEFVFEKNMDRYKQWTDKIRYIKITNMPGVVQEHRINPNSGQPELFDNCWYNERYQRDCLSHGIGDAQADDVIIVSDVDEIIRADAIKQVRQDTIHSLWAFRMPFFNYRFNYMWTTPLIYQVQGQAVRMDRAAQFQNFTNIREHYGKLWADRSNVYDDGNDLCIQHGGWHFSSLGSSADVATKLLSFAHSELAYQAETIDVDKLIAENKTSINPNAKFEPVVLDNYFPKAITENTEQHKELIIQDATQTVMDKLECLALPL
jgi:hypothetical protein